MRLILLGLAATGLLAGCTEYGGREPMQSQWSSYDYDRPDPSYGGYQADRYYREDRGRYHERQMGNNDRIYRGQDGRYYCRRSDGTTGLVVGAVAGGALGNVIAPGNSELLGTVLGAVLGGVAGREIDRRRDVRCR
ncbi:glycine zipper 2TM domain-containing protein [Novosphingobium sp.]|uniref:glycine zipper 2TM domain-containing protein n=1 Tax=Novosphingobium sp. TaxID=1874826 RepID=UPI00262BD19B|nr:glycine zipper 2TM domain-containing protein [Novosphingobium sp.]